MRKKSLIIFTILCLSISGIFAKTNNGRNREQRIQFGFGGTIATGNFLSFIETCRMIYHAENGVDYSFPGTSKQEFQHYNELSKNMQRAIWTANLFGSLEYNFQTRLLWNFFMAHADLGFIPMESSYNGRFDFALSVNAGIRAPFFIQPYLTAGVNFTFSFYPDKVANIENWKTKSGYGIIDNFAFRPGVNFVGGLDIKFSRFSIGVFYKYTISDFAEFSHWYEELTSKGAENAAGMIFGSQSRVGIAAIFYL